MHQASTQEEDKSGITELLRARIEPRYAYLILFFFLANGLTLYWLQHKAYYRSLHDKLPFPETLIFTQFILICFWAANSRTSPVLTIPVVLSAIGSFFYYFNGHYTLLKTSWNPATALRQITTSSGTKLALAAPVVVLLVGLPFYKSKSGDRRPFGLSHVLVATTYAAICVFIWRLPLLDATAFDIFRDCALLLRTRRTMILPITTLALCYVACFYLVFCLDRYRVNRSLAAIAYVVVPILLAMISHSIWYGALGRVRQHDLPAAFATKHFATHSVLPFLISVILIRVVLGKPRTNTEESTGSGNWTFKFAALAMMSIVLLALCRVGYLSWQVLRAQGQLNQQLAQLQANGHPVRISDVKRNLHVPEEPSTWNPLIQRLKQSRLSYDNFDGFDETTQRKSSNELPPRLTNILIDLCPNLRFPFGRIGKLRILDNRGKFHQRTLHQSLASAISEEAAVPFRVPENAPNTYWISSTNELTWIESANYLLATKSASEIQQSNPEDSISTIADMLRFQQAIQDTPLLDEQHVRIRGIRAALMLLRAILDSSRVSEASLERIEKLVTDKELNGAELKSSLIAERAIANDMLKRSSHFERLKILQIFSTLIDNCDAPVMQRQKAIARRQADLSDMSRIFGFSYSNRVSSHIPSVFVDEAEVRAMLELTKMRIAVERYRLNKGRLPKSNKEVIPDFLAETPTDPFSQKPLLTKYSATEVVIYSVGPDGTDDLGSREKDLTDHIYSDPSQVPEEAPKSRSPKALIIRGRAVRG